MKHVGNTWFEQIPLCSNESFTNGNQMGKKGFFQTAERSTSEPLIFSLTDAKPGDSLQIVALNGDKSNDRLRVMGLIPGALLKVMSAAAPGSVVVALQNQRLGLGVETAQQIQVISVAPAIDPTTGQITDRIEDSASEKPYLRLQNLAVGSTARVVGYEAAARPYRRKLLAMGLIQGTEFTIVRRAPLGDPIEIRLRGFSLSLRKHEANALLVESVKGS